MSVEMSIILTPAEVATLTGYRQPSKQLTELRRQGFVRARRNALGGVVLERGHYLAVCNGTYGLPASDKAPRPEVRLLIKPRERKVK